MIRMHLKSLIKDIAPPVALDFYRQLRGNGVCFHGTYSSWQDALGHAEGYDADRIIEKVREATLSVMQGKAVCERDSVLFDKVPYPFPLIATLLRAAMEHQGGLTVLDFGGALGSSYYQCRDFLSRVSPLRWCIVEQQKFAELGRQEFQNEVIRFYESVEQCAVSERPQVVLFSGVLQYLAHPSKILDSISRVGADYIVIDRTPFVASGKQIITVQVVPDNVVRSSYPVWLFSEQELKGALIDRYEEITTFDAVDGEIGSGRKKARFKGIVFRRKG